jgi:hypothetical protein
MSDETQPVPSPDKKPTRPKRPRPSPEPTREPEPPKRRRRKKSKVAQINGWSVDWYAVGIGILALFTFLPYLAPLLRDREKPKPETVLIDDQAGNVSTWLGLVASDDVSGERLKYVDALRSTAKAEISDASKVDDVLREQVEQRLGRLGWANWGLFNIEMLQELRRLRSAGKIDGSVKSHQAFLSVIADELERVGA